MGTNLGAMATPKRAALASLASLAAEAEGVANMSMTATPRKRREDTRNILMMEFVGGFVSRACVTYILQ